MWMQKLGGRKVTMSLVVIAVGTALTAIGKLTPDMVQLLGMVFGAFVVGNFGEHYTTSKTAGTGDGVNQGIQAVSNQSILINKVLQVLDEKISKIMTAANVK